MNLGILIPIFVVVVILVSVVPAFFLVYRIFKQHATANRLMQTGQAAQGQILSIQETGTRVNDQPEVAVVLMVSRPGMPPYQVQTNVIVSMLMIPRLQPGMSVPLKIDPANPQAVVIDTHALASVPMGPMGGAMPYGAPGMAPSPMGMAPGMPGMVPGMMPGAMQPGMVPGMMPGAPMVPGMMPNAMTPQQMAMAQQAMAQPPAGGGILYCPRCRNPYASANPRCPNCGAPKPM